MNRDSASQHSAPLLKREELEALRTPSDLSIFVCALFNKIEESNKAKESARLRIDLYKYLMREIYPLSIFASWRYPENNVGCAPQIGNQGYDAIIYDREGKPLEWIEITWPEDGRRTKQDAHRLNERGVTDLVIGRPTIDRAATIQRVLHSANRKAKIDYGNASLLIVFELLPGFFLGQADAQADVGLVLDKLRGLDFKARSVFLLMWPPEYSIVQLGSPILVVKDQRGEKGWRED